MAALIISVTVNPAWDLTYEVPALQPGEVHRVGRVHRRLGGKGVNVARVLSQLGEPVTAVLLGTSALGMADVPFGLHVVPGLDEVRQTVVVHGADGVTTSLWEPGAPAAPDAGERVAARVNELLGRLADTGAASRGGGLADAGAGRGNGLPHAGAAGEAPRGGAALVVSGSLPPGLDPALPAALAADAISRGLPAVVDADGEALATAARVPGVVVKPNADELERLAGHRPAGVAETVAVAASLLAGPGIGAAAILATLGGAGLVAVTPAGAWHGRLATPLDGNPTGAGDAAVAAAASNLARPGWTWPGLVEDAVALSAAAVLSPVAGEVDTASYAKLRAKVEINEMRLP